MGKKEFESESFIAIETEAGKNRLLFSFADYSIKFFTLASTSAETSPVSELYPLGLLL